MTKDWLWILAPWALCMIVMIVLLLFPFKNMKTGERQMEIVRLYKELDLENLMMTVSSWIFFSPLVLLVVVYVLLHKPRYIS